VRWKIFRARERVTFALVHADIAYGEPADGEASESLRIDLPFVGAGSGFAY